MPETLLTCPGCQKPNFTERGLKAHRCKGVATPASETEVVTAAEVSTAELAGLAAAIEKSIDFVASHEDAFNEATLEHRLEIGLHVSRAMEVFTLTHAEAGALKGKESESLSRRDTLPTETPTIPTGFVSWLEKNVKRLKRPTAYKYAAAFRALAIPAAEATPATIKARVKDLRHKAGKANLPMPTLASLVKAAPKPPKPETLTIAVPKSSKQLKLEDAREAFHNWKAAFDKALKSGHLEHLDKKGLEELRDFTATVRDRINARLK